MSADLLTDADIAERLRKAPEWVQEQCRAKRLPHIRAGKSYRFTEGQYAEIVALLTVQPAETPAAPEQTWDVAPGRRSA